MPESELSHLIDQLKSLRYDDYESSDEDKVKQKDQTDLENNSDLSGEDNYAKEEGDQTDMTMTAFDEYESKSMELKNFHISDRAIDPEAQAKEEYMRKLMSFRKDELILPEESDDDDDEDANKNKNKEKNVVGVEDAYDLVERVEDKMSKIAMVIKGMDKRMSYNLRLIGSVMQPELMGEQTPQDQEVKSILKNLPFEERKQKILPKIKMMSDYTTKKLDMTSPEDQ